MVLPVLVARSQAGTIAVIAEPDSTPRPVEATIEALLAARGLGKTICPSEVARVLAGDGGDWRARMPEVHDAVDAMLARRAVDLSWKGRPLARRGGPYRIGRGN